MTLENRQWDWQIPSLASATASVKEIPGTVHSRPLPGIWKLGELVRDGSDFLETDSVVNYSLRPDVYLKSIGVPREIVHSDFSELLSEQLQPLASKNTVAYLRAMLQWLMGRYSVQVKAAVKTSCFVTYLELHCPKGSGAYVRLDQSQKNSEQSSFMVKLFGVGGGEGGTISIGVSTALESRDGRCYAIQVPVELLLEDCVCVRDSVTVSSFTRASVLQAGSGLRQALIAECTRCNRETQTMKSSVMEVFEYDLKQTMPNEIAEITLKVDRGRTSKSVLALQAPPLASSFEFSGEVSTLSALEFKYRLPGGAMHYAFCPRLHPFYYWSSH